MKVYCFFAISFVKYGKLNCKKREYFDKQISAIQLLHICN